MNGLCSLHFVSLATFYQFCQQFLCGTVSFNMVFCLKQIPMGVQYANTKGFSFESQKKYFQLWSALQVCGTKGPVIMPGLDNIMAIPNCIITVYSCHCLTQLWVRAITENTCHSWINFGNQWWNSILLLWGKSYIFIHQAAFFCFSRCLVCWLRIGRAPVRSAHLPWGQWCRSACWNNKSLRNSNQGTDKGNESTLHRIQVSTD